MAQKMQSIGSTVVVAGVLGLVSVATAAPAPIIFGDAIYTDRSTETRTGEKSHAEILEHIYGGTFVGTGVHGLDFTNGEVYIQRIADDRIDTPQPTAIGETNGIGLYSDQFWEDQFSTVEAHGRFGEYWQYFGLFPQAQGGEYHELFQLVPWDYGFDVHGEATVPDLQGSTFRWARGGQNGLWNSDPAQNRDGLDHLITYKVISLQDQPRVMAEEEFKTFLLFWEDQSDTDNMRWYDVGDWDYNDLVVEVRAQYNVIPEPTSLAGVVGGLALLGWRRRR